MVAPLEAVWTWRISDRGELRRAKENEIQFSMTIEATVS
jgi:hypothetical protein